MSSLLLVTHHLALLQTRMLHASSEPNYPTPARRPAGITDTCRGLQGGLSPTDPGVGGG